MTVHVDQMVTEVSVDTPAPAGAVEATGQASMWTEQAKVAALRARMLRDELRTRATGYDD